MKYKKSVFRSFAMVTQLGLSVLTPIFMCTYIGYMIDRQWGTKSILVCLLIGVVAGGKCGYHMAKATLRQEQKEDEKEKQESLSGAQRIGSVKPKPESRIFSSGEMHNSDKENMKV